MGTKAKAEAKAKEKSKGKDLSSTSKSVKQDLSFLEDLTSITKMFEKEDKLIKEGKMNKDGFDLGKNTPVFV